MMMKKDKCEKCYRWDKIEKKCSGWTDLDVNCSPVYDANKYMIELNTMLDYLNKTATRTAYQRLKSQIDYLRKNLENNMKQDWESALIEDMNRGTGGGGNGQAGNSAGLKAKMKDNRPIECKTTRKEREEMTKAYKEFEAEHGKLETMSTKSVVSRKEYDSYTGERLTPQTKVKIKRKKAKR